MPSSSFQQHLFKLPVVGAALEYVYNVAVEFATEQRGWFVLVFVLPMSILFDLFFKVRAYIVMKMYSAPELHQQRVDKIANQLKELKAQGFSGKLVTARGGWQSTSIGFRPYKQHATQIAVNLYDIIELDTENKTVKVEPYVNMGQLSHFLNPKKLTIPVLPELDDLTVGGLMMGVGIETSSHKYGLFDDNVVACEVILADGTVVNCSATENAELFDALPWSYGTLGFLASVTLKVIAAKDFVRIEYIPCHTREQGIRVLEKFSDGEDIPDFVESLQYSSEKSVVMLANMVDAEQAPWLQRNSIGTWYKPWFYKHVESFLDQPKAGHYVEYIPMRDYYHRHTKSIFWEMEDIIPFGNETWFRFLFGWMLPVKVSFLKLTQTDAIRKMYEEMHVVQDMLVPFTKLNDALDKFDSSFSLYPLWLCPYRAYDYTRPDGTPHRHFLRKPKNVESSKGYKMMIDIGAYGTPQMVKDKKPYNNIEALRSVEHFVIQNDGFQMMYAESFMTREEFRTMFDHSHYDAMKKKYDPNSAFPKVFEKTCSKGMKEFKEQQAKAASTVAAKKDN